MPGPVSCQCCGGDRLRKLGEDITETLEVIPRQWKVIQTVREKFTCRDCEKISQAPAPFHAIPRGWAGPNLLAMILFDKFGQHLPLNRQVERFKREGVPLSLSTVADSICACCAVLEPILKRIEAHTFAAERCTATTRRSRFWRQERPISPATVARTAAQPHLRRCFTIPVIARASTRRRISPAIAAFCRRTPIPVTPNSICRIDGPAR